MFIPLPYKILIMMFLVGGAFGYGFRKGNERAEVEINKYANQVEQLKLDLEKEQNNIKEKVVTQFVDKVQIVKEKEYVLQQQATEAVPAQHDLSNGWVYIHNHSTGAEAGVSDPTRAADGSSSGIKDNEALLTIISNYSTCLQNAQQLIGLQNWVSQTKKSVEESNKK